MHKIGQIFKKILLLFLACIMVIIILPPVLFYNVSTPTDYGEFLRFSPVFEEYTKQHNHFADASKGEKITLDFDISHFEKTDVEDIVSAKIRLAFLRGSGSVSNKLSVKLGNIEDFAVITPYTKGDEDVLWEIDATEYVRELIRNKTYNIRTEISSANNIGALMATSANSDPSMRPCLKIATGQWVDIDAPTLKKAEILNTAYISKEKPHITANELTRDRIYTGAENVAYISTRLNQSAFWGEVSSAVLSLEKLSAEPSEVKVHFLNNNEWTPENLSADNLPLGPEMTAKTALLKGVGRVNIDITQGINEARKKGIETLTLYITGSNLTAYSKDVRMYIKETDDKALICALDAGVYALSNNNAGKVTTALRRVYTSENGERANIVWKDKSDVLRVKENGELIRPLWYEEDASVAVEAEISSGNHKITREFDLTILREEKPSYNDYEFKNFINIGKSVSEKEAEFESVRTSGTKRRWTGWGYSDYRTLSENGAMLLNLACNGNADNYITFKLWKEDLSSVMYLADCLTDEKITIKTPELKGSGFGYATYKLPESFTKGKDFVSLRLFAEEESCGIYAVYITDSPCFNPAEFKAHGEKIVENVFSAPMTYKTDANVITFTAKDGKAVFELKDGVATVLQSLKGYDRYSDSCPVISESGVYAIDYGEYKLIWNKGEEESSIPYDRLNMSGVYRDAQSGIYYTFPDDLQTDAAVIPQDATAYDGKEQKIKSGELILLVRIANPMQNSVWRVAAVNGRSVAEMGFDKNERLESVELILEGSLEERTTKAEVIVGIYENEKLVSLTKKEFKTSRKEYKIDFSDEKIYIKENQTMRIFVADKNQKLFEIQPIVEIS